MSERPLFLERASFRRRRLGDAARVLPVLSALAVLVPVWWLPHRLSGAGGAVWLAGLWAAMIVAVWALHRALLRAEAAAIRAVEAAALPVAGRDLPPGAEAAAHLPAGAEPRSILPGVTRTLSPADHPRAFGGPDPDPNPDPDPDAPGSERS